MEGRGTFFDIESVVQRPPEVLDGREAFVINRTPERQNGKTTLAVPDSL